MSAAFPPVRARASVAVPASTALEKLQTYLAGAAAHPYLLPNATLQVGGTTSQGGAGSNLVIHNLKRVEAGLRGEWLAPSLELDGGEMGGLNGLGVGGVDGRVDTDAEREGEGWVDLETYQREQSIEGEVASRHTGAELEDLSMDIDFAVPSGGVLKTVDKEARKREKKARKREKKNRVNK